MLKPLWNHDRAIVFADDWYEWKKEGNKKQPYYIYRKDRKQLHFAAIGKQPFDVGDEAEGFLRVTAAADKGLVDIHDRRPIGDTGMDESGNFRGADKRISSKCNGVGR